MNKLIIFLIIFLISILLTACMPQEALTCQNTTINNTIIQEINTTIIKEVNITPNCPVQEPTIQTITVKDTQCEAQRIKLIKQLDYSREVLADCLASNSTQAYDNKTEALNDCNIRLEANSSLLIKYMDNSTVLTICQSDLNDCRCQLNESC